MIKTDFQADKQLVRDFYHAVDGAKPANLGRAISEFTARDFFWRGMHPFNELHSGQEVAETFWQPLRLAMGPLQRRPDMFLAGSNLIDGDKTRWVVQMGHLMGLWDEPWLGIPQSGKIAFLRYADFHRIENGKIAETACHIDIVSMMYQAGLSPFAPQTGANILTPGPKSHAGLLYDKQDPQEGLITRDLITAMISELISTGVQSPVDHLARFWTPDMCWFGPGGIGASAFFAGYRRGHTKPFEDGLDFIKHYGHICRIGEGNFGGFFGYPSMQMKSTGGFMGMPATDVLADMRIVDLYRREGDKLAENWIFIDLLHFFYMQGLDVLGRLSQALRT